MTASVNRYREPEKRQARGNSGRAPTPDNPGARRRWKNRRATSLRHSLELCVQYAKDVHNLSVERIAERMGLTSHWRLYKWVADGNMPIRYARAFEHACGGCDFVTRYLAAADHKLVIDIPTGRTASPCEISELQALLSEASGALVRFYSGEIDSDAALEAVEGAISGLGYHRDQVVKHSQPELALFETEAVSDD